MPPPDNPDEKNHPLCPSSPRSGVKAERVTNGLVPEKQIHLLDNSSRGKKEKTINGTDEIFPALIPPRFDHLVKCDSNDMAIKFISKKKVRSIDI